MQGSANSPPTTDPRSGPRPDSTRSSQRRDTSASMAAEITNAATSAIHTELPYARAYDQAACQLGWVAGSAPGGLRLSGSGRRGVGPFALGADRVRGVARGLHAGVKDAPPGAE